MPDSWDSNDGQTQHLDENGNTVGAQIGVRVVELLPARPGVFAAIPGEHTHLAIPLDAESLARLRERIEQAMADGTSIRWLGDECQFEYVYDADAVLAALGLDPS